ncbi:SRPBCC domain-containing protein [Nocardia sp. NPDC050413]|uniref:SRPBCC family protein n=1 Tax=Nocardia sp. NPDC050413 TaxID=3155784 RepID=UPI0033C6A820
MSTDNELDPSQVELGRFYPQALDQVWQTLTEPALIERWLMAPVGFEPHPGTHFLLMIPVQPPAQVACEVIDVVPGKSMTWSWTDMRGPEPARWIVTWELRAQGRGTRLLLTTSGFDITDKRQRMQRNNLERGWRQVLTKLGEVVGEST